MSKQLHKRTKKVYGVGTNDANYYVFKYENGKNVWRCPYHQTWVHMLERCYSEKFQLRRSTYKGCTVCDDWLSFMAFRAWMTQQEWEGNELDKDLKVIGNKVYSPDTCMFVSAKVNTFIVDHGNKRGNYPIGVNKRGNRYRSQVADLTGKIIHLGYFSTPEQAYFAWRDKKIKLTKKLIKQQDRKEVKKGLKNYIKYRLKNDYYLTHKATIRAAKQNSEAKDD